MIVLYKCKRCNGLKGSAGFYWSLKRNRKGKPKYRNLACKDCILKIRKQNLNQTAQKYGLTESEYLSLLEENPVCAICHKSQENRRLVIDHCHDTGKVRGVLCGTCNSGLGYFKDNIALIRKAIDYLERNR